MLFAVWLFLHNASSIEYYPSYVLVFLPVLPAISTKHRQQVPSQLGNLFNCTDLFLNNNKLSGKVPDTLGDMESLERLRLHANSLTGAVPSSLCGLGLDQLTADCADLPQLGVLISCPMGCCTECY